MEEDEIKIKEKDDFYTTLSLTHPNNLDNVVYWKPIVRGGMDKNESQPCWISVVCSTVLIVVIVF